MKKIKEAMMNSRGEISANSSWRVFFREHRGTLTDSLATEKEFSDIREMFAYIRDNLLPANLAESKGDGLKITVSEYGFDKRVERLLYLVEIEDYGVVGFLHYDDPAIRGIRRYPHIELVK
ncbi:MAG: hypothetical protein E6Q97_21625 [Desulfurellales bacterium]|nr:MAG: hypothetical protein E6Q97_21625 [Desulfurellales bacterium]